MDAHEFYMQRCLDLGLNGLGRVSPNPLVGSVIVHEGKVIGEGYHVKYGKGHAEVNAIASVANPDLLKDSTLYVNLEPCAHFGKTPPCASLIIEKSIPNVVIGCLDPFSKVNGAGMRMLREAGIHVSSGVLEEQAVQLNKRFFTYHTKKRPYIILKWAQTADDFIARNDYSSKWISNQYSRLLVHKWRMEEDAIMVGTNTAVYDNPLLNSRDMGTKIPVKVLIDPNARVPLSHYILDGAGRKIVFGTGEKGPQAEDITYYSLDFNSPEVLYEVVSILHDVDIQSVIIEGGSFLLNEFLRLGLWDEARVFTSAVLFNNGIAAPVISATPVSMMQLENDELRYYFNPGQ